MPSRRAVATAPVRSLTPTPCEPRMMERPVSEIKAAYKAVNLEYPESEADDSQDAQGDEESRAGEVALRKRQIDILRMRVNLIPD